MVTTIQAMPIIGHAHVDEKALIIGKTVSVLFKGRKYLLSHNCVQRHDSHYAHK